MIIKGRVDESPNIQPSPKVKEKKKTTFDLKTSKVEAEKVDLTEEMLSGDKISSTALAHAKELLN